LVPTLDTCNRLDLNVTAVWRFQVASLALLSHTAGDFQNLGDNVLREKAQRSVAHSIRVPSSPERRQAQSKFATRSVESLSSGTPRRYGRLQSNRFSLRSFLEAG
jgi:hypothetical protein